jgi:hypothetical protein
MLAVSFAVLSGCDRQSERVFDETSSARVQALIDLTYSTLTSSEEGWYLEYFPGWDGTYQTGGYWFWLKFDTLDQVTGESLVTVASELVTDGTTYTTATSPYEIIRGHGAVLTFRIYNEVMDIFCLPTRDELQGKQGDLEFRIVKVTDDVITVVGTRTGMTMRFLRKTAGRTYTEDFDNSAELGRILNVAPQYTVAIKGIDNATVTRNDRKFEVKYKEIIDGKEEDISKLFTLFPSRSEQSFTLRAPVEIAGVTITGFTFAYNGTAPSGEDIGVYTSTDADQTITFTQVFPEPLTFADLEGGFTMSAVDLWGSEQVYDVVMTQTGGNDIRIEISQGSNMFPFMATFDADSNSIVASTPQDTGFVYTPSGSAVSHTIYLDNYTTGQDVTFTVERRIRLIVCKNIWGFRIPTISATSWWDGWQYAELTKK